VLKSCLRLLMAGFVIQGCSVQPGSVRQICDQFLTTSMPSTYSSRLTLPDHSFEWKGKIKGDTISAVYYNSNPIRGGSATVSSDAFDILCLVSPSDSNPVLITDFSARSRLIRSSFQHPLKYLASLEGYGLISAETASSIRKSVDVKVQKDILISALGHQVEFSDEVARHLPISDYGKN